MVRLQRHPLIVRFSPDGSGLASLRREEPPPRHPTAVGLSRYFSCSVVQTGFHQHVTIVKKTVEAVNPLLSMISYNLIGIVDSN